MIPIAKPYFTEKDAHAAYDVILGGWVAQGPKVAEFEQKFAAYTGAVYAVAVSNCTAALHLAMIVAGIGPGDEVICPSMSYIASANSILYTGARPVFAEVDPLTYNIDPIDAEKRITSKTKAILIVHQIGLPADIDVFKELCQKHNLQLIEDAACAIGSSYKGRKIGSHSELVCFSFHPRKVISTGEGGMITTNNESHYNRLRMLRQHGMAGNIHLQHQSGNLDCADYSEIGYNYRMTDIQAAIGIKQLEKVDWIVDERRKIAAAYNSAFREIDCIRLPVESSGYSNYQSYCIFLTENCPVDRNGLMRKLADKGISTRSGIMCSHRETSYKHLGKIDLPVSESLQDNSIIIPLYVPMERKEVVYIIDAFRQIIL